jgi:SAM-dependent methyltransferase
MRDRGPLLHPHPPLVAGVPLPPEIDRQEFRMLACQSCGFQYRSPAIPLEALIACYEAASEDFSGWKVDPLQRRFDTMRDMLTAATSGRRILDIGCFHASFLEYLGPTWQRFGVEPSRGAAAVAQSKGVQVLAPTLEQLPADTEPFDVITAMDLIEHLNEPLTFFQLVHRHLKPGGVALLLSGDVDAPSWKMLGSLYWYCSLPEHCAFFSQRSLSWVGSKVGLTLERYQRTSRLRTPVTHKVYDVVKNVGYIVGRSVGGFGVPRLRRLFVERCAPGWLSASDHFIALMRKPAQE